MSRLSQGCFAIFLFLSLVAVGRAAESHGSTPAIESIGIFNCYTGMPPEAIPFFKACGYNTYQRWDMGWTIWPSKHERYYAEVAEEVQRMQREGFRVYVLLNLNMIQRQEGEQEGYAITFFDPADRAQARQRAGYIAATVRKLKMADGFGFLAGDPGGHPNASPPQCGDALKEAIAIIAREAPNAEIHVNPWSIASWDKFVAPYEVAFWEKEVVLSRNLVRRADVIRSGMGVEFPMHNYYRSLALSCYAKAGRQPELYPLAEDVALLRRRGVKQLWGWPYFLTDECDDGYSPGTAGITQAETRYLKQIVDTGRRLGLNGMVGVAFKDNIFAESLNLYAFARFCKDPKAMPEQVIAEFAGFIAEPQSVDTLAAVLKFIENQSTWQAGLPEKYRLPNFDLAGLTTPSDACNALAKVSVRKISPLPMPQSPAAYVEKLRARLRMLIN